MLHFLQPFRRLVNSIQGLQLGRRTFSLSPDRSGRAGVMATFFIHTTSSPSVCGGYPINSVTNSQPRRMTTSRGPLTGGDGGLGMILSISILIMSVTVELPSGSVTSFL